MKCEIVQQWVGQMSNTFWYCRDHKVECSSQWHCPATTTKIVELIDFHTAPPQKPQRTHFWDLVREECTFCGMTMEMYYLTTKSGCSK